jgi:hypothetical protein
MGISLNFNLIQKGKRKNGASPEIGSGTSQRMGNG